MTPLNWIGATPDGIEWFSTRAEAEAHVLGWFDDYLDERGETHPDGGFVAQVVGRVEEVVGATRDEDSDRGEWLRERGLDYYIGGYRIVEEP